MPPDRTSVRRSARGAQQASRMSTLIDTTPYARRNSEASIRLVDSLSRLSLDRASVADGYAPTSVQHRAAVASHHNSPTASGHRKPSSPPPSPRLPFNLFPVPYPGQMQPYSHRTSRRYAAQEPQPRRRPTPPTPVHSLDNMRFGQCHYQPATVPPMQIPLATPMPSPIPISSFNHSCFTSRFLPNPVHDLYLRSHHQLNEVAAQFISQYVNPGGGSLCEAPWAPRLQSTPQRTKRHRSHKEYTGLEHRMARVSLADPKVRKAHGERVRASLDRARKLCTKVNRRPTPNTDAVPNASPSRSAPVASVTAQLSQSPVQQATAAARRHSKASEDVKALGYQLEHTSLQDPQADQGQLSTGRTHMGVDQWGGRGEPVERKDRLASKPDAKVDVEIEDEEDTVMTQLQFPHNASSLPGFGPTLVACVAACLAPHSGEHSGSSLCEDDDMRMNDVYTGSDSDGEDL